MILLLLSNVEEDSLPGQWAKDVVVQTVDLLEVRNWFHEDSATFQKAVSIFKTCPDVTLKIGRREADCDIVEALDMIESYDSEFDALVLNNEVMRPSIHEVKINAVCSIDEKEEVNIITEYQ